jgi:hypothetical protein
MQTPTHHFHSPRHSGQHFAQGKYETLTPDKAFHPEDTAQSICGWPVLHSNPLAASQLGNLGLQRTVSAAPLPSDEQHPGSCQPTFGRELQRSQTLPHMVHPWECYAAEEFEYTNFFQDISVISVSCQPTAEEFSKRAFFLNYQPSSF